MPGSDRVGVKTDFVILWFVNKYFENTMELMIDGVCLV